MDQEYFVKHVIVALINAAGRFINQVSPNMAENLKREMVFMFVTQFSPVISEFTSYCMKQLMMLSLFAFSSPLIFFVMLLIPLLWGGALIYAGVSTWEAHSLNNFPLHYTQYHLQQLYLLFEGCFVILGLFFNYILTYPAARYMQKHIPEVDADPFDFISKNHSCYRFLWNFRLIALPVIFVLRILNLIFGIVAMSLESPMVFLTSPLTFLDIILILYFLFFSI